MFLFPSQTAAAVTPQVSAVRRTELCLFCTENTQHGPGPQWRVSHLSFYNTDPGFSGVCHYLSTTLTQPAVACVSLSFYNTDSGCSGVCLTIFLQHGPSPQNFWARKWKKSVSLGKNLARNTTVGALKVMRDFSQFCTLLWVISYIFIRDAGAPLRPRTRPGNMRTFVVIVTCQHPRQIEPLTIGKSEYCTLQVLQNFLGKYICIYRCENLIQWQTLSFALCYFVCV